MNEERFYFGGQTSSKCLRRSDTLKLVFSPIFPKFPIFC
uniref:Uncharacterized protein n=1 Tax=Nelumbo nucifera TaxID=4432 RepID=A0A822ZKY2_NELNU|nr:TPA_asm: hypothetical protein HUJ06_002325 [Nelumbo nucifera]DAD44101.1 TPA_asm: hypothetical protein HUJ06_002332 [Nelumbo nucifera]